MSLARQFVNECCVIFVHNTFEDIGVEGTMNMCGKTSIHELTALVDAADVVVTVDSATLWLAHCTTTPVIALLGTTREKEKLRYHRNYVAIDLAALVGCESCFGTMRKCGGVGKCMSQFDVETVGKRILDGIKRFSCS
jgi:ADP-heptose:LPS heptosyltransferase